MKDQPQNILFDVSIALTHDWRISIGEEEHEIMTVFMWLTATGSDFGSSPTATKTSILKSPRGIIV